MRIFNLLIIGLGGAIGTIMRVIVSNVFPAFIFTHFPIPIMMINIIGCFFMGALSRLFVLNWVSSQIVQHLLITGILGGFTTFSAFVLEIGLLTEKNLIGQVFIYSLVTFFLTIVAFFLGIKIVKLFIY